MDTRVRSSSSPISGRPYRQFLLGSLILDPSDLMVARLEPGVGVGIEASPKRGRSMTFHAYPETLVEGSLSDLVTDIAALSEDPGIAETKAEVGEVVLEIDAARAKLRDRIRDPHPLYESIRLTLGELKPGRSGRT